MVLERISQQTPSVDTRIPVPTSNIPPPVIIDCTGKGAGTVALKIIDNAGAESTTLIENGNANFTSTTLDGTGLGDTNKMLIIKNNAGSETANVIANGNAHFQAATLNGPSNGVGDEPVLSIATDLGTIPILLSNAFARFSVTTLLGAGQGFTDATKLLKVTDINGVESAYITAGGDASFAGVTANSVTFPGTDIQTTASGYIPFSKAVGLGAPQWEIPNCCISDGSFFDWDGVIVPDADSWSTLSLQSRAGGGALTFTGTISHNMSPGVALTGSPTINVLQAGGTPSLQPIHIKGWASSYPGGRISWFMTFTWWNLTTANDVVTISCTSQFTQDGLHFEFNNGVNILPTSLFITDKKRVPV
jgi:hypothetical protein